MTHKVTARKLVTCHASRISPATMRRNIITNGEGNRQKYDETPTLSKILCKWKQDSVISFSLYLDSVFKYKHKLVHNQSPV